VKYTSLIILFILPIINSLHAFVYNDNFTTKIDTIIVIGNKTTEEHIILRELDFKIGDFVSQDQLNFNEERVFSLGIFNKVKFNLIKDQQKNTLEINVEESWFIYPLPFLKLRENSFKRSSYGLNLLYKNFRGRNETLWALFTFGYDPTFQIQYINPVLSTGSNLTFSLGLGYTNLENRSIQSEILHGGEFSYNYIFGNVAFGYRLNQYNILSLNTIYEYIDMPSSVNSITASKKSIDRIVSFQLSYELDNRNLKQFSNNGTYALVDITHKGLGINNISYNIVKADLRQYNVLTGDLALKWRGLFRSTFGKAVPFYALSLLGDEEYLRGHRFNKREGNNYIVTSFELNYPLVKEWNFSIDLPLLPKNLTSARIGLYANLFIDSGTTFNNGESIKVRSLDTGYGFGFTLLILPYNAFRFEYAMNEFNEGEFILETGFSF
jgi:outer membrane protein assembly factor BamA